MTATATITTPAKVEPVAVEPTDQATTTTTTTIIQPEPPSEPRRIQARRILVILQLCAVTLTASLINGLVIVGLPTITKDLQLPSSLSFWPSSVGNLATASTLLLAGSIADTVGPRWVELAGSVSSGAMMLGQGFSRTGEELVVMRALQGIGLALHLSSSISIITQVLPQGRGRNLAFSCVGLSQPLGFSLGLVVGGILVDTVGWRSGWYIAGGITLFFAGVGLWALPSGDKDQYADIRHNIRTKVDWVGAGLASAFMALICYLLA